MKRTNKLCGVLTIAIGISMLVAPLRAARAMDNQRWTCKCMYLLKSDSLPTGQVKKGKKGVEKKWNQYGVDGKSYHLNDFALKQAVSSHSLAVKACVEELTKANPNMTSEQIRSIIVSVNMSRSKDDICSDTGDLNLTEHVSVEAQCTAEEASKTNQKPISVSAQLPSGHELTCY